jgi:hypothetical protein
VYLTDNHFKTAVYTRDQQNIQGYGNVQKQNIKSGEKYCVPSIQISQETSFLQEAISQSESICRISISSTPGTGIDPSGNSIQCNLYCQPKYNKKSKELNKLGLLQQQNQGLTLHDDGRQLTTEHSIGMFQLCVKHHYPLS